MRQVLSILVQNQPGVLVRVASMFARRGFNIESLAVGVTERDDYSRITAVVAGAQPVISQVVKQLEKLIEVEAVQVLPREISVARGMGIIKIHADIDKRAEILKLAEVFRANVVDVSEQSIIFEITGDDGKMQAFQEMMRPYGVMELIRTGTIGLLRGNETIYKSREEDKSNG